MRAVPDVLIFADTFRSAELRHEVPIGGRRPDPLRRARTACGTWSCRRARSRSSRRPATTCSTRSRSSASTSCAGRAARPRRDARRDRPPRGARARGRARGRARRRSRCSLADRLRARGVELDAGPRALRRAAVASKSPAELAGIRRAQAAAEAGMAAARDLLRARPPDGDGVLEVGRRAAHERAREGRDLAAFLEHGATADGFIVSHGPQSAIGHHLGEGQIRAGETVVIDLWPRDNELGVLRRHDADVRRRRGRRRGRRVAPPLPRGARRALAAIRPGVTGERSSTRSATSSRRPASRRSGRRRRARSLERGVPPRARPRRRARGARGADPRPARARAARRGRRGRGRARPLPRRATAACASRISCSSPRTAARG